MKTRYFRRLPHTLLVASIALAGTAAAHPGDHGAASEHATFLSGLKHFLTSIDHVGPVIAALLLVYAFRRRAALRAAFSSWRSKGKSPDGTEL